MSLISDVVSKIIQYGCRPAWLSILTTIVLLLWGISTFSSVLIEDLQMLAFPFILLCFCFLPIQRGNRLPGLLLVLAFSLWVLSVGAAFELYSFGSRAHHIYLSRLADDHSGLGARALYQRYNEIARTYHLPWMDLVQLSFLDDRTSSEWLKERPLVPFLIRGSPEWLRFDFPSNISRFSAGYVRLLRSKELPEDVVLEMDKLSLIPGDNVFVLRGVFSGQYFVLPYLPEFVNVPGEPKELGLHAAAWFAAALRSDMHRAARREKESISPEAEKAKRYDAWFEASRIEGLWKSRAAEGLAHYFLATLFLLEAEGLENRQPRALDFALENYRRGASCLSSKYDAPVYSALFNNAAVTLLFSAHDDETLRKARKWFQEALRADHTVGGTSPLGVRAAVFNLLSLEKS